MKGFCIWQNFERKAKNRSTLQPHVKQYHTMSYIKHYMLSDKVVLISYFPRNAKYKQTDRKRDKSMSNSFSLGVKNNRNKIQSAVTNMTKQRMF